MPNIDPRPFGGPSYASGVYGNPSNPLEWQHQPGDHSDTGILPLLTPVTGTGGVSFGFSTSGTGEQTFTGTGGVTFGFALAGTGTVTVTPPECAFDGDVFDGNAFVACEPAIVTDAFGSIVRRPPVRRLPVDDDEDIAVLVAVMRHRFHL